MKIGLVSRTIPPFDRGGIQVHVRNLAIALDRLGHNVHLFISGEMVKLGGVVVHPVKASSTPGLTLGYYLSLSRLAAREAQKHDLDILHGHSMYAFGLACMEKRRPFVVTIHGTQIGELRAQVSSHIFNPNHLITDSISAIMEAYASRKAAAIIAVSKKNKEEIIEHYSPPQRKVHVVPNGVWVDDFTSSDMQDNSIVFIGRLHERKGVDILIKAMPQVISENPDTVLKILGSGEMEGALRQIVKKEGLVKNVRFMGCVSERDKANILSHARLLVMPSLYEGFGIVMIEGMASGLPVVATPVGAAPDVIIEGKNGYVRNINELASAINNILSDEKKNRLMGRAARKTVEDRFDWMKVAHSTVAVYKEVLGGQK